MLTEASHTTHHSLLVGIALPMFVLLMLPAGTRAYASHGLSRPFVFLRNRLFGSGGTVYTEDGMPVLPDGLVKYSQVPGKDKHFTADKIPSGLLKAHTTKAGTWGKLVVFKGRLEFTYLEPSHRVFELSPDTHGVIEPTMKHQVKALSDDLEFVVEFHRMPDTGPVKEKREGL